MGVTGADANALSGKSAVDATDKTENAIGFKDFAIFFWIGMADSSV
jgi:hypothetical protein